MYNRSMKSDLCLKCGKCCQKITVDFTNNIIYKDGIEVLNDTWKSMLLPVEKIGNYTICKCKYISANLCTNVEKPVECKSFPSSPFAFIPENCGYDGEIFLKREKIMQRIRKLKEEILHYSILIETSSHKREIEQYKKIIANYQKIVDNYKLYGSIDW